MSGRLRTNVSAPRKPTIGTAGISGDPRPHQEDFKNRSTTVQEAFKKLSREFRTKPSGNRQITAVEAHKSQKNEAKTTEKFAEDLVRYLQSADVELEDRRAYRTGRQGA